MNVLAAGLITIDIIQLCKENWVPLEDKVGYFSGGTAANIVSYLGKQGWNVSVLGGVGDDFLGELLKRDLETFNVDTSGIVTHENIFTRRIGHLITQDPAGYGSHKFTTFCTKCKREFPPFDQRKNLELFENAKNLVDSQTILIIDRANDLTLSLAKHVSANGGVVIFEPGYLSKNAVLVKELLLYADIIKYSEELKWNETSFNLQISSDLPKLKIIIETRGKKGVRLLKANKQIRLTTTPMLSVEDSAGAGDAFMAGFLYGIGINGLLHLHDVDYDIIEKALERGQALGGLACRFISAKGILHVKKIHQIEDAIAHTMRTLQAPVNFHSSELPAGMSILAREGHCTICHLPLTK